MEKASFCEQKEEKTFVIWAVLVTTPRAKIGEKPHLQKSGRLLSSQIGTPASAPLSRLARPQFARPGRSSARYAMNEFSGTERG
jgi:hypothetical protein